MTRFAVIADVHGNADALSAVLADIDQIGIGDIINLGDHFSGPLDASGTADLMRSRNMRSIRGNHDRALISATVEDLGPSDRTAYDQLEKRDLEWLNSLPPFLSLNTDVFACHGTPWDDETYLMQIVDSSGQIQPRPIEEVVNLLNGLTHKVVLCGHSHLPDVMHLPDGRLVVNPGSVGCPAYSDETPVPHKVETGSAAASYAVIEYREGKWHAGFRKVAYDTARMAATARSYAREEWAVAVETGHV